MPFQCPPDQAERIRGVTGRSFPPAKSFFSLQDLPIESLRDLEKVYAKWGSITAAYFLGSSTEASLNEIKLYLDSRGWHESAD